MSPFAGSFINFTPVAKAMKRERRHAAHLQNTAAAAAPGENPLPPPPPPVVVPCLSAWRSMTVAERYGIVAAMTDAESAERATVESAHLSEDGRARLLMCLGKRKIVEAANKAAESKKQT